MDGTGMNIMDRKLGHMVQLDVLPFFVNVGINTSFIIAFFWEGWGVWGGVDSPMQ